MWVWARQNTDLSSKIRRERTGKRLFEPFVWGPSFRTGKPAGRAAVVLSTYNTAWALRNRFRPGHGGPPDCGLLHAEMRARLPSRAGPGGPDWMGEVGEPVGPGREAGES